MDLGMRLETNSLFLFYFFFFLVEEVYLYLCRIIFIGVLKFFSTIE